MKFDVLVVGAGINGLSAAYQLSKNKNLKIGVIDQFAIGHTFGSSHGISRITRTTYNRPQYINMMHRTNMQEWPLLEKELGKKFLYKNPGCFFGTGAEFEEYVATTLKYNFPNIKLVDVPEARQLFPQLTFNATKQVLVDNTGGIIAAHEVIANLKKFIIQNGVKIYENTKVLTINRDFHLITLITDRENLVTEKLVITAGPWVSKLVPALDNFVTPIRQTVAYVSIKGPQKRLYQVGTLPYWLYFIGKKKQIFYEEPEFGEEGLKVGYHVTHGLPDDPDVREHETAAALQAIEAIVREQFVEPIEKIKKVETCFYSCTPQGDFIMDFLPEDNRIVLGAGYSGHGFKFAPLTGKILAELALNGKTSIPEFENSRELFKFPVTK